MQLARAVLIAALAAALSCGGRAFAPSDGNGARGSVALPRLQLAVVRSGIHRVAYETVAALLPARVVASGPLASDGLGLHTRGEPHPVWIEDGGDGSFGPGDSFEFWGDAPQSELGAQDRRGPRTWKERLRTRSFGVSAAVR